VIDAAIDCIFPTSARPKAKVEETMLASDQIEELICVLESWDRETLIDQFQAFHSHFPVDFTSDYLTQLSVEKLRHVFLALCLQNKRMPNIPAFAA
jgi:hypothetical protein